MYYTLFYEFCNENFYKHDGIGLYPLKQYSQDRLDPLQNIYCQNGNVDGNGSSIINEPEAKRLVEEIAKCVKDNRYDKKTFGVIALQGHKQAEIIEALLLKKIGESEFNKRNIVCGNSTSFQGDERDIIFLSLVTAHNHNRTALTTPGYERRFNVAVSRAKEQIWLFHSVQMQDLRNPNDLRYKLLNHFKNKSSAYPHPKSKSSPARSYSSMENKPQVTANKTYSPTTYSPKTYSPTTYSPTTYSPTYKIYTPIKYSVTSK